jgi:hypothetical protein
VPEDSLSNKQGKRGEVRWPRGMKEGKDGKGRRENLCTLEVVGLGMHGCTRLCKGGVYACVDGCM